MKTTAALYHAGGDSNMGHFQCGVGGNVEYCCNLRRADHRQIGDGDPGTIDGHNRAGDGMGASEGHGHARALHAGCRSHRRQRGRWWVYGECGRRDVPAPAVTVTLAAPSVALAAIVNVAVICVAQTTLPALTVIPPLLTATVAPEAKFVPVRVTGYARALRTGRWGRGGERGHW